MKPLKKTYHIAFPAALAVCLLLFLLIGGSYFTKYLQARIFEERTTQLNEITSQVRANLDNALNFHWNYLTTAVNALEYENFNTVEDMTRFIGDVEQLLETDQFSSLFMLLDSQGNCYDAEGKHGVWSDLDRISGGGSRYTFITESRFYDSNFWAFVQKLDTPIETGGDTAVVFTHIILLKDIHTLSEYYDSAAYGSHNETYILKSNGTRMHDNITEENTIHSYNVLKVLEDMEGQEYPDIREALTEKDPLSTNFRI